MEPRLSIVTLGVADLERATAFYTRLGFERSLASSAQVTFLRAGGVIISLFGRSDLAQDAGVPAGTPGIESASGFSGIALAHNVRSDGEVDDVLAEAVAAGARLLKPGQRVFWGGYSGYFADPDGHLWEVAHNPFFPLDHQGAIQIE